MAAVAAAAAAAAGAGSAPAQKTDPLLNLARALVRHAKVEGQMIGVGCSTGTAARTVVIPFVAKNLNDGDRRLPSVLCIAYFRAILFRGVEY